MPHEKSVRNIVIIEDNPADAELLRFAIRRHDPTIELVIIDDGGRAQEYFSAFPAEVIPPVDLVLLDLNLPLISGLDVLEFLKNDDGLKSIPVIMLSGSSRNEDVERSYAAGANCYICKPTGIDAVLDMAAQLVTFWFRQAELPRKLAASVQK